MQKRVGWCSLPRVLGVLVVVAVVLVSGVVGLRWMAIRFLHGEEFRGLVEERVGAALKAEAAFQSLDWSGSGVFSSGMTARRGAGWLAELEASQIRGRMDWRAAWGGAWRLSSVEVLEARAVLRKPSNPDAAPSPPLSVAPTKRAAGWFPHRFELGSLVIRRGGLVWDLTEGGALALRGSEVTITPKDSMVEFSIIRGQIAAPGLPAMELEQAHGRLSGGEFFLTDAAARVGKAGKARASGGFAEDSGLRVSFEDVELAPFIPDSWRNRLVGHLYGEVLLKPSTSGLSATGHFALREGRAENIPLLSDIGRFTASPQFVRMPVQEASGNFSQTAGDLTVSDFVLESKGLLRAEGGFTARGGERALAGRLRVGVSSQVLQWLPGSRERVFTETRDGYLWTDVQLGGTLEQPTEDLTARLLRALGGQALDSGSRLIESAPDTIQGGAELLRKGADGLLDIFK